jgi:hypothetical protein
LCTYLQLYEAMNTGEGGAQGPKKLAEEAVMLRKVCMKA